VTPSEFLEHIKQQKEYSGQIVFLQQLAVREAHYGRLERPLPLALQQALQGIGVRELYCHQAEAINVIRDGGDAVVATPAASGKTLTYNIPVLESVLEQSHSRALYLFPTKALAQDQLRVLTELTRQEALHSVLFGTYDGDTQQGTRRRLRQSASILLTNPDMLHLGILPNHSLWSRFLANLKYVVIDEAHAYRGVFGSQVACVLRRLLRLCRFYGASPQFICCSATIANPAEHVGRLTSRPARLVDQDGSPRGRRQFVLWNPPVTDPLLMERRSVNVEATTLFVQMVENGIRNITFVKARRTAELILQYAREQLRKEAPGLVPLVSSYRGGYRPELRREIESGLFSGELLGVTATSALELGVDVGHLDATVMVGYPGTIASTWQQAGRAGRGRREALNVLIGMDNPLDQYVMRHPEALFGRAPEHALIAPDNHYILAKHLPCAAYEQPLSSEDEHLFGPGYAEAMAGLEREGTLEYRGERWYYRGLRYPAEEVSLRSVSAHKFAILDESQDYRMLEELEETTALSRVYRGAVYLHQGESYLVRQLDLDAGIAKVMPVELDYYTEPREVNSVRVSQTWQRKRLGPSEICFGELLVTQQVVGYRRLHQQSGEVLLDEPLDLPEQSYLTTGLWFDIGPDIMRGVTSRGLDFAGGLHAVEHAAIGILPLFAMCDWQDIAGLSTPLHPDTGLAQIFIYDGLPGGMGIAEKGFALVRELWSATLAAIGECECQEGCPGCIQSPKCGNNNQPLDKQAAVLILRRLLEQGELAQTTQDYSE
jgi:DEAD/DEAH box helicase domain-containing protein